MLVDAFRQRESIQVVHVLGAIHDLRPDHRRVLCERARRQRRQVRAPLDIILHGIDVVLQLLQLLQRHGACVGAPPPPKGASAVQAREEDLRRPPRTTAQLSVDSNDGVSGPTLRQCSNSASVVGDDGGPEGGGESGQGLTLRQWWGMTGGRKGGRRAAACPEATGSSAAIVMMFPCMRPSPFLRSPANSSQVVRAP